IELANDIYLNNRLWNGIRFWNAERPATFDGNGYTIHDLYINDNNALGLFGNPGNSGTTVNFKDLTIDGVTIEQKTSFVGSLAGNLYGDIENVHVKNVSVVADDNAKNIRYGGIIGMHNSGNATNCSVENITISGVYHNLGGMTGTINETSNRTYTNCYAKNVDLSISCTEGSGQYMVGALIGNVNGVKATLTGCYSINCNPTELVGYGTSNVTIEATEANGVKYANISEAISAGATEIELIGNVTEEFIAIGSGKEITLTGNGTFDGQFQVSGKLIANGITFTNANASSEGISKKKDNALYIQGEGVIELTNCTFNIEKATAITSWWSSASTNPSAKWNNIILKNCVFNCNGNRPLQIEGNATIEGCTFNDPYRYCAQLTCGNVNSETVVINFKNNTIGQASTSGKPTYGLQLTCDYGNSNMVINGEGNTIVDKGDDDAIYVYEEGTGISNGFVNIETITLNATDQNGWVVL
ncbi:MAG: hypothetical protein IJY30_05265, partial [Muribaculaceae bacterium]|nr:hypothetical protein [Muribaculaceae bacterium]